MRFDDLNYEVFCKYGKIIFEIEIKTKGWANLLKNGVFNGLNQVSKNK